MDESQQNQPKRNKFCFSLSMPTDLNNKLEYIKKRTFFTKQQIMLMLCSKGIESWCKTLMDEEIALRTAKAPEVPIKKTRTIPTPQSQRMPLHPDSNFVPPQSPHLPPYKITSEFSHLPPAERLNPPPAGHQILTPSTSVNKIKTNYVTPQYDPWTVPLNNKKGDK